MQEDEEDGEANPADYAELMLKATFKTWDFLEESGFEVDELAGKELSFIVKTPDGGGRRLAIGNLMREIDTASSMGEACEACFLQVVVNESEGGAPHPPWDDAAFPVSYLPPPRSERATDTLPELREEPSNLP